MVTKDYYTLSELLNEVSTKQEFKAKKGSNVDSSNKKEQGKAVRDITKGAEDMDKPARNQKVNRPRIENNDFNKGLLHPNFETEPSNTWKERVKAQVMGYPSEYNRKNNDYDASLDFSGNEEFYKSETERVKRDAKSAERERKSGLKASAKAKDGADYSNKTAVKESIEPMKRLVFRNTTFLSEAQVLKRVPEEYKINENRFYMRDNTGTDYLIECNEDSFGCMHVNVVNKFNKQQINEQLDKINKLSNYSSSNVNKTVNKSQIEDMTESINLIRDLMRK